MVEGYTMWTEDCDCPVCGYSGNIPFVNEEYNLRGEKIPLGIIKCKKCYLVYTSPRLNQAALNYIYNELYASSASGQFCITESIHIKDYQEFCQYAVSLRPQGGKLLDIGCGVGNFLMQFKNIHAFEVQGIEISKFAVSEAQKKGLNVIQGDFMSLQLPPESFDLISMLDVLEYMAEPVKALKEVARLLSPGGHLLIAVPNWNYLRLFHIGPICKVIFKTPTRLHAEEHLLNFTPQTLAQTVRQANLIPSKILCGSPETKGGWLKRSLRTFFGVGVKTLYHLGIHLGRIHLLAQKPTN